MKIKPEFIVLLIAFFLSIMMLTHYLIEAHPGKPVPAAWMAEEMYNRVTR